MRITVFGGTGPTGLLLIEQALAAGHDVVAYARTPGELPAHERLTAVEGQLDDAVGIGGAVRGSDAVLSVLGPVSNKADILSMLAGYRNIIAGMRDQGVERLVALGTPTITEPGDSRELKIDLMVAAVRRLQPLGYGAFVSIGELVRDSGLKWTIVRVPLLTNGPQTATVNVRRVGDKGGARLSRANAAAFILEQVTDPSHVGRAPLITDK
jgi:nucleoside-diphosphate-sugar epimerase